MESDARYYIVAVEESDSSVGIYDPQSATCVSRIDVGFWPHEIDVSADGRLAYVTNFGVKDYDERIGRPGASISIIDVRNALELTRLHTFRTRWEYPHRRGPHGVKLSPKGELFVNVEQGARMLVFDLEQEHRRVPARGFSLKGLQETDSLGRTEPVLEYPVPEGTHNFIIDHTGETLFVVSGRGGITAIDSATGRVRYRRLFDAPVRGLVYTPDGKALIAALDNEVRLLNPADLADLSIFGALGVGQLLYAKPTLPDSAGRYEILAPAVWQSQIVFIDPASGKVTGRALVGLDPIHIQVGLDNRAYVSHGRSRYLSVLDLEQRKVTGRIPTRGGPNGIALVPRFTVPARATYTLGACLPLSSPNATEGREIRLGYEFWRERVNAAGGLLIDGKPHTVDILYRDYNSEGPIKTLARELVAAGAQALLGTYPTPPHGDYAAVALELKRPLITATGAGTGLYQPGNKYFFGIMSPARLYLSGTIEVVRQLVTAPQPTLCILSCRDPAAYEDATVTAAFAIQKGFRQVLPPVPPDLPDPFELTHEVVDVGGTPTPVDVITFPDNHEAFTAILERLNKLDIDLFLMTGHLPESIALVDQARRIGFRARAIGLSVGPALASFRSELVRRGTSPEFLFGASQWTPELPLVGHDAFITPAEFARAFQERFSMKASYFSAGAYACGVVLQEALRQAGTGEADKVCDALRALSLDTFFSHIEFNRHGLNASKPMYTIQLRVAGDEFYEAIVWPPQGATWPIPSRG